MGNDRRTFLKAAGAGTAILLVPGISGTPVEARGQRTAKFRLRAHESIQRVGDQTFTARTYNGSFPGPVLRARVGDRVIVDLQNDLPVPTTIHWHGVEVPANQDGSSISQIEIPPGSSQRYEFDALSAGMFWYHPHTDPNVEVEQGLQGVFLIEDRREYRHLGIGRHREHVLVLDDLLLDEHGIAPPFPTDPLANAVTHFNGRRGDLLLVNGHERPTINVRNSRPQRLRVVNTANSRFMRLSFGPDQQVWRIGGDGGLLEAPLPVEPIGMVHGGHGGHGADPTSDEPDPGMVSDPDLGVGVMLTPGERADLVWLPSGDRRDIVSLELHDWPRGDHGAVYRDDGSIMITHDPLDGARPPQVLADFRLLGNARPHQADWTPPADLRTIERLPADGDVIPVTMGHGQPGPDGEVVFFLQRPNGMPKPFPMLTPDDVVTVEPGEVRLIEVTNLTMGAHNFHLHGFFFQHVETQFFDMDEPSNNQIVPAGFIENKDTILVPGRTGAAMRSRVVVRLAVRFDDTGREGMIDAWGKQPDGDRSGGWLMHCHLLEHSDSGMMSFVQVRSR